MRRTRLIVAGFIAVSGLVATQTASALDFGGRFEVTVTNLTRGQTFTPVLVASHGEGVTLFEEGRSTPGGSLPINTNGGGLSYTHSGMYGIFPIIEATRQLRGECGARQVPGARLSLVNGMGGMLSAAGTLVLASDR